MTDLLKTAVSRDLSPVSTRFPAMMEKLNNVLNIGRCAEDRKTPMLRRVPAAFISYTKPAPESVLLLRQFILTSEWLWQATKIGKHGIKKQEAFFLFSAHND